MNQFPESSLTLSPTPTDQRIISLDVIRGFALWGILIVNIVGFATPYLYANRINRSVAIGPFDTIIETIIYWLVQGKFYTLFSLLFGFGFMLLIERARERTPRPALFFLRRLFFLLCFGIGNAFFLWWGDILITYAIIGMFLLFFYRRSVRTLLWWAIALPMFLTTLAGIFSMVLPSPSATETTKEVQQIEKQLDIAVTAYQSGAYEDILAQIQHDWLFQNNFGFGLFVMVFLILPLFLLGAAVYRNGLWQRLQQNRSFRIKWLAYSFVIGVSLTAVKETFRDGDRLGASLFPLLSFFGDLALASFYATALLSLLLSKTGSRLVQGLQYAGRMALTNYLLQAVFCGFIFYPYGLGLYNQVPILGLMGIATFIFLVQVLYSRWWLQRFSMGPMESVWRVLTYGKLRKNRPPVS